MRSAKQNTHFWKYIVINHMIKMSFQIKSELFINMARANCNCLLKKKK